VTVRIACGAFALLFVFGAVVQWNDPDPLRWMVAYAAVASLSAAAAFGRTFVVPTAMLLVVLACWVAMWAPAFGDSSVDALQSFGMSSVQEEEVREVWGLVLLTSWTGVLLAIGYRRRQ
jgi:hypothetical protein